MYIPFLVIITVLSLFPFSKQISQKIIVNRKYISYGFYILCFASLLFLFGSDNHNVQKTGELSIALLWIVLWLPILSKVLNLGIPKTLMMFRKEIGILMGTMAMVHGGVYMMGDESYMFWEAKFWYDNEMITNLAWGFIATFIAIILTLTSNNWSIKKLGKKWKLLHRAVYIIVIMTLLHVVFLELEHKGGADIFKILGTSIPFVVYFGGKILEWKGIVLRKAS